MTIDQRLESDCPIKGFLGLPTEIRIEIYYHLLIARKWPYDDRIFQNIEISTKKRPRLCQNFKHMSEVTGTKTNYCLGDRYCRGYPELGLAPAILRTCKEIHDEAAPILYSRNVFYFPIPDQFRTAGFTRAGPAEELRLRSQCLWLFGYRDEAWHTLFFEIQASMFARFLHMIGKENAARLTTLRFLLGDPTTDGGRYGPKTGQVMKVVMQLLYMHVPGLRDLNMLLVVNDRAPYHTLWTPHPTVERVLYDVLKEAVRNLPELKHLEIKGFGRDPGVKRELKALEVACGCRKDQAKPRNLTTL